MFLNDGSGVLPTNQENVFFSVFVLPPFWQITLYRGTRLLVSRCSSPTKHFLVKIQIVRLPTREKLQFPLGSILYWYVCVFFTLSDRASTISSNTTRGCQSGTWLQQRGTNVKGSHHGGNPLLKPTGIQIATKPLLDLTTRQHREFIRVKTMSLGAN